MLIHLSWINCTNIGIKFITLWSWVAFECRVIWNMFFQLRMHQSLNDMQRVIQDSAHFLLTSDKSHYTSPDPVLHPLTFVCELNPTGCNLHWVLSCTEENLQVLEFFWSVFNWELQNPNWRNHSGQSQRAQIIPVNLSKLKGNTCNWCNSRKCVGVTINLDLLLIR